MRRFLLCLQFLMLFIGLSASPLAQPAIEWERTFGGKLNDYLSAVVQTSDGGYLFGGGSYSNKSGDKSENNGFFINPWIVKVDANGAKQWDKTVPVSGDLSNILLTEDDGYLLGGGREGSAVVVKLDNGGNVQWEKPIYGGEGTILFGAMEKTLDGGYIVGFSSAQSAGGIKSQEPIGSLDYWLVKLDADGNILWEKLYGGTQYDGLTSIQVAPDGGYLIAGYSYSGISNNKTQDSRGDSDLWIIKLDASGNLQWDKTIGGTGTEFGPRISVTTDGGYILGARSSSKASGEKTEDSNGNDYWVIKLSNAGQIQWQRSLSGGSTQEYFDDDFRTLMQTSDGGYLAGGHTSSPAGNDKTSDGNGLKPDMWIVKLAPDGTTQWDKTIGSAGSDFLLDLIQTTDGGFFLGGHSNSNASGDKSQNTRGIDDYWVVKLAPENPPLSETTIRINAGGPNFTTATKKLFIADKYYAGIDRTSSIASGDILNTTNDVLYRSGRSAPSFSYNIPVQNGQVNVTLHFAEIYFGAPGKKGGAGSRQFHVNMEGSRKLTNYDIFAQAGGAMRANQITFPVTVTDGVLNVDFLTGAADQPRVCAIEVVGSNLGIIPLDDACVRGGAYSQIQYGYDNTLNVKDGVNEANNSRSSYLKFRLQASAPVTAAKLRVYGHNHENDKTISVHAYGVDNDNWKEHTITKQNAPAASTASLGYVAVNAAYKYYEIDVTSYVKTQQQSGDTLISFLLNDPNNRNTRVTFNSKEADFLPPQLVIQTTNSGARLGQEEVFPETQKRQQSIIYPNPIKDYFTVSVSPEHAGPISFEMVHASGKSRTVSSIQTARPGENAEVNIAGLSFHPGIYLLKIKSNTYTEVIKTLVAE